MRKRSASRPPTRGDYDRLRSQVEVLRAEVTSVRDQLRRQNHELQIQFVRMAEMQTILDEEHKANNNTPAQPEAMPRTLVPPRR